MKSFYRLYVFLVIVCIVILFAVTFRQDINISDNVKPIPPVPEEITSTIKLYFANNNKLIMENRLVTTKDMVFEKFIVEELIKGPRNQTLIATMSQDVRILSIETIEKICYVNFSREYIESVKWDELEEDIIIWSLVNSLTQLDYIQKVQILVEGEKIVFSNSDFSKNQPFSRKDDLIKETNITHFSILKDFLDSLKMERYDKAYSMLDKGSRMRVGFQEFREMMSVYIKELRDYEIGLFNTQKFSDRVNISIKYFKNDSIGQVLIYQEWKLIEENGEIKIVLEDKDKIGL
ncbi:GerMN domain-containing protein [Wukongibacter sp. M2B1]|uniref:GerMN domain-containing protein n=1 Tax=Wukongibacter sp. M2B1 TaxID=3088895 RepID=UPI003D7976B9